MLISKNPANNYIVNGEVPETTEKEIIDVINKAKQAQKNWQDIGIKQRTIILNEIYQAFNNNIISISELITKEIGKPITQAETEVKTSLNFLKWDLENAEKILQPVTTFETEKEIHQVFYEPKGVVVSITPFNYPFSLFIQQTFQNLIVGNVVINKPDQNLPLLYKLLESIIKSTSLPMGVQQFVFGGREVGKYLVNQNIDMICFTGNTTTGQYLYQVAASKMIPILMELGGSAPGIICEDADIDKIIDGVFKKKFSNNGQLCHALKRLIVHESKYDEVIEKLKLIIQKQVIGNPNNKETTIGSLVNEEQLNNLISQYDDALKKGAICICGGKKPDNLLGSYYEPTLLTNITRDMKVWQEEVFGPILPIVKFKDINEAIELANDTIYGLGGYVFTTNQDTFMKISKALKTGMVSCNNLSYSSPTNPFGGVKYSGNGRVRGEWGFKELCNVKIITFEK